MTLKDGERGRFGEQMVSWVTRDSDRRSVLVHIDGRVSLGELVSYLADADAPVGRPDEILVNGSIRWERDATDDERAQRASWQRKSAERHAAWEREQWALLQEKYGPDGPPLPEPDGEIKLRVCPPETDGAGRVLPEAFWEVTAQHVPSWLSYTARAEHKITAVEQAIRGVRSRVQAEAESRS